MTTILVTKKDGSSELVSLAFPVERIEELLRAVNDDFGLIDLHCDRPGLSASLDQHSRMRVGLECVKVFTTWFEPYAKFFHGRKARLLSSPVAPASS